MTDAGNVKIAEAKQLVCPFSMNREPARFCRAHECMAWRWIGDGKEFWSPSEEEGTPSIAYVQSAYPRPGPDWDWREAYKGKQMLPDRGEVEVSMGRWVRQAPAEERSGYCGLSEPRIGEIMT